MNFKSSILAFALALLPLGAVAQGEALTFTRICPDPVMQGQAGAGFASVKGSSFAALGASAMSSFADPQVSAGYLGWNASGTSYINAGAILGKGRTRIGLAASYGLGKEYDIVDESNKPRGTFAPSDMILGAGITSRLFGILSVGLNARYVKQALTKDVACTAVTLDAFVAYRADGFSAALGLCDAGTKVTSSLGYSYIPPMSVKAALSYDLKQDWGEIEINADADAFLLKGSGVAAAAGIAYTKSGLSFRAGYRYGGATCIPSYASLGFGYRFGNLGLDFSCIIPAAGSPLGNTFGAALTILL